MKKYTQKTELSLINDLENIYENYKDYNLNIIYGVILQRTMEDILYKGICPLALNVLISQAFLNIHKSMHTKKNNHD